MKLTKKTTFGSLAVLATLGIGSTVALASTHHNGNGDTFFAGTAQTTSNFVGHGSRMPGGQLMTTLAKDLNLSPTTLQSDLKSGKTVADIAKTQGISTTTLISELETAMQSQLSQQVSSGKLTSTQEQTMVSHLDTMVTNFVNGTMPKWSGHGPSGRRMLGGQMMTTLAKDLNLSPTTLQSDLKSGKTVADIAKAQGISTTTLISELETAMQSQLSQQVSSGKLTSTQEQTMVSHLDTMVTNFVNGTMPKWRGHGPGGRRMLGGQMMTTLAKDLNLSPTTLQSDLKSGKTVADIAKAQGISTTTLISELEATMQSRLSQQVSSGKLTTAQEQTMVSHMDTMVTNFVNGTMPKWSGHGPGGVNPQPATSSNAPFLS